MEVWNEDYDEMYDWEIIGYPAWYIFGDNYYMGDEYLDERWKRVVDADGYWVSDYGRVWSEISERFIHGTPVGRCGHIDMSLHVNGRREHRYLHRMVAQAFKPNPHKFPIVRHLNDDPSDNYVDNLEWGDPIDNVRDCIENGHFRYFTEEDYEKAMQKRRMPIIAVNLRTGERLHFESQCEAARVLRISQASIGRVVRGIRRSASGWYFVEDNGEDFIFDYKDHRYVRMKPMIRAINIVTGEKLIFEGLTAAALELGMSISMISTILHGRYKYAKNWTFEYVEEDE